MNPLYIVLTPFAYVARLSHQLPILFNQKQTSQCLIHDKYRQACLPSDASFVEDKWKSFQYIEWRFSSTWNRRKCKKRSDEWSMSHFQCKSNFIDVKGSVKSYVQMITRQKPSMVIRNATHLIVFFKHALVAFLDHYFCDGLIIADFVKHMFAEENISSKVFPTYVNLPLISDYMAIDFSARMMYDLLKYPSQIQGVSEKTRTMSEIIRKDVCDSEWNRWTLYAHGVHRIFQAVSDIEYVRVGLNVGFNADTRLGNNRIGMVIVTIKRPAASTGFDETMRNLKEQLKTQASSRSNDANTTFDMVRAYDIGFIRKFKMKRMIDVWFTSLFFKEELTHNVTGVGGFIGVISSSEFVYISTLTFGSISHFTYVSNWKQMNYDTMIGHGVTIDYEFNNQDPNQF